MTATNPSPETPRATRRDFLKTAAAASATVATLSSFSNVHAAGSDVLKVGLIGCGNRGSGAAEQACAAGPNIKLTAMADMFKDRLDESKAGLKDSLKDKFAVKDENCFVGFNAYKQLLAGDVDVVLLCSPPGFRPAHIEAAVAAKKHMFCEKPVAVDAPGVRRVLAACELAKKHDLSIVSGLCWRYHYGMRETFDRIHNGGVGDIVALQCNYLTGALWDKPREDNWTDMEWQLRNWLYFTWLSGDFNVEQHVHSLDKMAWAMKNVYPASAVGIGGRQVRTETKFGHIFDHHAVVYEWKNGVKCFAYCRQQKFLQADVNDWVMGTKGTCDVMKHTIKGEKPWRYVHPKDKEKNMYQIEHNELFASIRDRKPINDGEWMTHSTMMAIMGRMATYTGQVITWEKALASKEDLTPAKLDFGPLATPPVAQPGITKFI